MKSFLKRANRGLILGAIVLVGFVVFVITDTIGFKKNKPQIEAAVTAYTSALGECAVTSSSKDEFKKKADNLMSDYWCSDSNSGNSDNYYEINISGYRNQLDTVAAEDYSGKKTENKITKWTANPFDFSITKSGPGYATVQFECEIVAEFTGNPYLLTPCEVMPVRDFSYYGDSHDNTNALTQFSMSATYVIKVKEIDGKWKVCSAQSWGWASPELTVLDQTEGGEE